MNKAFVTSIVLFVWLILDLKCCLAAGSVNLNLLQFPSGLKTVSEVDGGGAIAVILSEAVVASPLTVICHTLESGAGVTSVSFENATVPISSTATNVTFRVVSAGRAVSVQCTGQSNSGSQYTLDGSRGNKGLLQVTRWPTVSLCSDTVFVPSHVSSGTVQVQFSEIVTGFPVEVNCSTKTPVTKGTKNPLQLEFVKAMGEVGQNKAQVSYTVLKHGSPVLVACRAQTYNITMPTSVIPASSTASVSPFKQPFRVSLENVDRLQYLYNKSEGLPAIFALDNPSLTFFPLSSVFMVNGTYKTLLALDIPPSGTVTVKCSLGRLKITDVNSNSSRLCAGVRGSPTVSAARVIFNGVTLQLLPQEFEYKKGESIKTVELALSGYPTTPVKELVRVTCCTTDTSIARYRQRHAVAFAWVDVLRYRTINWGNINTGQVQTTSSIEVELDCPCDLRENQCDASCCCDKECSTAERKSFSCLAGLQGGDKEGRPFAFSCLATWPDSSDWQPFLCVVSNNSPFIGYFYNFTSPASAQNSQSFITLALNRKSGKFSYSETENRVIASTSGTYKVGSAVRTADNVRDNDYATAVYGALSLPQSVVSGLCSQTTPVLFLENFESRCVQQVLEDSCSTASSLSALNYIVSRRVTRPPCPSPAQVLKDGFLSQIQGVAPSLAETEVKYFCVEDASGYISNTRTEIPATDSGTSLFTPRQAKQTPSAKRCEFDDSLTAPPKPEFNSSTRVCSNVVLSVKYQLEWSGQQILRVRADVTMGDVTLKDSNLNTNSRVSGSGAPVSASGPPVAVLTQSFAVSFVHRSNASSAVPSTRAGNPGYIHDSLVVSSPGRLLMWSAGSDSLCAGATTTSVTYGTDAISGCLLRLSLDDMRNCSKLRDLVKSNQDKLIQATQVGRTGNSNTSIQEDWIPVISGHRAAFRSASSESPGPTVGRCTDIPAVLHIELLVSEAGKYRGVPQMEIVGTRVSYGYTTWQFECTSGYGVSCLGDNILNNTVSNTSNATLNSTSTGNVTSNVTSTNSSVTNTTSSPNDTREYVPFVQHFLVTSSVAFVKVPSKDPPRVKRSVDQSGVCYQERCKEELFYPLTTAYQGQPTEQVIALSLALVLMSIGVFAVTRPWG